MVSRIFPKVMAPKYSEITKTFVNNHFTTRTFIDFLHLCHFGQCIIVAFVCPCQTSSLPYSWRRGEPHHSPWHHCWSILLVDFMASGTSINTDRCQDTDKAQTEDSEPEKRNAERMHNHSPQQRSPPCHPLNHWSPGTPWMGIVYLSLLSVSTVPVSICCGSRSHKVDQQSTSATKVGWKMRFVSSTWWQAGMTWEYINCYSTGKNASTKMVIWQTDKYSRFKFLNIEKRLWFLNS